MIVVKLEMWPGGDATKAFTIGRTYINNVGGSDKRGDYDVRVMHKDALYHRQGRVMRDHGVIRKGHVSDYPRQSYNVWRLIIRALLDAFPEEKVK